MARKSKNQLAQDKYGYDFDDLEPGEKAGITKKFNAQVATRSTVTRARTVGFVLAKIGRSGNGVQECSMAKGATIADLVKQGKFTINKKKEEVIATSNGLPVDLSDEVEAGEIYMISAEIESNQ